MRQLDSDGDDNPERTEKILDYEVSARSKLQSESNSDAIVIIKEEKVDDFGPILVSSCDALDSKVDSLEVTANGIRKNTPDSSFPMLDGSSACPFVAPVPHTDNPGEDCKDGYVKKVDFIQFATDEIHSGYTLTAMKGDYLEALAESAAASIGNDRNGVVPLILTTLNNDESRELDDNVKKEKLSVNASSSKATGVRSAVPRTSIYHGVTRHRWSGKYEAHLWDSTCRLEGRRRKGKQVYLGSYDTEEKAARSYDIAALKYWGADTRLNFHVSQYEKELKDIRDMSTEECVTYLRRRSCCFSRGASVYRGVTRRQRDGRWQARIGRVAGTKDIYLGTFKTEEEAAEAYDIAAIELRGMSAITNFDISNYCEEGLGLGLSLGLGSSEDEATASNS